MYGERSTKTQRLKLTKHRLYPPFRGGTYRGTGLCPFGSASRCVSQMRLLGVLRRHLLDPSTLGIGKRHTHVTRDKIHAVGQVPKIDKQSTRASFGRRGSADFGKDLCGVDLARYALCHCLEDARQEPWYDVHALPAHE